MSGGCDEKSRYMAADGAVPVRFSLSLLRLLPVRGRKWPPVTDSVVKEDRDQGGRILNPSAPLLPLHSISSFCVLSFLPSVCYAFSLSEMEGPKDTALTRCTCFLFPVSATEPSDLQSLLGADCAAALKYKKKKKKKKMRRRKSCLPVLQ
ncbi:hypothetical protein AAFF_G00164920 [Aldrovandia affinis]|uniref:Uncharacterized protein n=1 Tax=Aldrovandia affinis TaxID=143900 RepID=A0AAD7W845_9TELE|nr:hypothetical protein AAFF_G00164920 [Aldrovandia affinis]